MPSSQSAPVVNRLLEALPAVDLRRLLAGCETVRLASAQVLYVPRQTLGHVYFPTGSAISLIMAIDDADALEVGRVGDEGMFGVAVRLGVDVSPVGAVVQGAGTALRMDAASFRRALQRSPALQRGIDRYVFVQLCQLAQAAACTRFHLVEARLARWLLATQDRLHSDRFDVTQELLASRLGVRRVGVTKAASALQRLGLIRYSRGDLTILDRRGLRGAACGCYKADRESYDRILGYAASVPAGCGSAHTASPVRRIR